VITITSVEAQSRFGELIDRAQREPVEVTRRGRPVAYVVSEHDMRKLEAMRSRLPRLSDQRIADLLAMPAGDAGELDLPRRTDLPRVVDIS
jgi:prevent-host-death family protein